MRRAAADLAHGRTSSRTLINIAAVIFPKLNAHISSIKNIYLYSKAETLLNFYVVHLDSEIKRDVIRNFRIHVIA